MLIKKNRIPVIHIISIGILPSFIKKAVYKLMGYQIAKGVNLSLGSVIIGKNVSIGEKSSIGFFTIVRANTIKIGRYVKIGAMSAIDTELFSIGDDARINEQVYIGGMKTPESALIMGKRTIIMQASYINPTKPIIIGDDSGIGGHCLMFTHGSWNSALEGYPVKFAPITIGKKVWLPWRIFVMPGVTIGDGAVIGADSLITKDIPANSLAAGNPAKIIKEKFPTTISEDEKENILQGIIKDFTAYLNHHEFTTKLELHNTNLILSISKHNTSYNIVIADDLNSLSATEKADIIVIKHGNIKSKLPNKMYLALDERERLGTHAAGEELVSFLSRYGVRFNRLD